MTAKHILVLTGSPRENGNSSLLADQIIAGARAAGAEVEAFFLQSMNIHPCDACGACQATGDGSCTIEDDMQTLYPKLSRTDAIVIASPIYWFTMSAQTKLCIDRWYAFDGPQGNALSGKQFAIALSYGDTDPVTSGAINAIRTFQDMCRYIKAGIVGMVYGSASGAGDIARETALMERAYELGEKLGAAT
jgi:multimeric flavodoxin WrbA